MSGVQVNPYVAQSVVTATREGRVLTTNGNTWTVLSRDRSEIELYDITNGTAVSEPISESTGAAYGVEWPLRIMLSGSVRTPEQALADERSSVELASLWGLSRGTLREVVPFEEVAGKIVLAWAEGRVLHDNGGIVATVSPDGNELVVLTISDRNAATIAVTHRLDDVSAFDYLLRQPAQPASFEHASDLASLWGVAQPERPRGEAVEVAEPAPEQPVPNIGKTVDPVRAAEPRVSFIL